MLRSCNTLSYSGITTVLHCPDSRWGRPRRCAKREPDYAGPANHSSEAKREPHHAPPREVSGSENPKLRSIVATSEPFFGARVAARAEAPAGAEPAALWDTTLSTRSEQTRC